MWGIQGRFWPGNVKNLLFAVDKKNWELIYLSEDHKPSS
jgi:hypothetical protein